MNNILGIFAKQPKPGFVKSRLAAATSPEWAAQVAEAFLLDWIAKLKDFPAKRVLVYDPADAEAYFAELIGSPSLLGGEGFEIEAQSPGDLGKRMETFLRRRMARGCREGDPGAPGEPHNRRPRGSAGASPSQADKVVIIGTDSPTLPLAYLHRAFAELDHADVVLGPARDGGYYLIGCVHQVPDSFTDMPWGEATVLEQTLARLRASYTTFALLPEWYDVDTLEDWNTLREEMNGATVLSHTQRLLTCTR